MFSKPMNGKQKRCFLRSYVFCEQANCERSWLPNGPGKSIGSFPREAGGRLAHRRMNNKKTNTQRRNTTANALL